MKDNGYDEEFAVAITGASSCIGPIIPPTISGVVYCVASGVSVGKMFIAGILPGCCLAVVQMIYVYIAAKKREYPVHPLEDSGIEQILRHIFPCAADANYYFGRDHNRYLYSYRASVVAVLYALLQGFLTRDLKWKDLPGIMDDTLTSAMSVLFIVSCANAFGYIITAQQIPGKLAAVFLSVVTNKFIALLVINIFYFWWEWLWRALLLL